MVNFWGRSARVWRLTGERDHRRERLMMSATSVVLIAQITTLERYQPTIENTRPLKAAKKLAKQLRRLSPRRRILHALSDV